MKHSPLQLLRYFAPEVSCSANLAFDPAKECDSVLEQLSVGATVAQQQNPENAPAHSWSVEMKISQKLKDGQNFPYRFDLTLVGIFTCKDGFRTHEDEEQFVRVNGSSMLYGAAREVIRSLTSRGPWGELLLPTLSFYDKNTKPQSETAAPKTTQSETPP
jgi:preprotein translocase subunit SecB